MNNYKDVMMARSLIKSSLEKSSTRSNSPFLFFVFFLGVALITLGIVSSRLTREKGGMVRAIGAWAMDIDLSSVDASFWGEDDSDKSGIAVSGAGDVDGDGYDDLIIGAFGDEEGGTGAGQTYLILGKASGWSMDMDLSTADASFLGEDIDDQSGHWLSGVGDVNGDGYDDFIIGAPGDDDGGSLAGQTYLILGKVSGWSMDTDLSTADASFFGEGADDATGKEMSGVGDVNGDGYDDFIIGADGDDDGGSGAGQTYLILGKASGWSMDTNLSSADASFWGEDLGDHAGQSVSGVGDVNGDGYGDFVIGAPGDDDGGSGAGQTYLILGKASGWSMDIDLSTADASFWGEDADDGSGKVSGVGDVNGDGYDDFVISAINDEEGGEDVGQTYLILGKASGWSMDMDLSAADASFLGENVDDCSGYTLSGVGDVNGDEYDDFIIVSSNNHEGGTHAGQTYLILGKASGWSMDTNLSTADASFLGEDTGDASGEAASGIGDVDGNGYDDFAIGANGDDDGGSFAGQTYLIFPPTYVINNLGGGLIPVMTSDWGTDVSVSGQLGIKNIAVKKSSYVIATLDVLFTEDRDWGSVLADANNQKSVFYYPGGFSAIPGATGSGFSLYVPIPGGVSSGSVVVCPNATSLSEVTENCSGRQVKTEGSSDTSKVTVGGGVYWKIDNLTGSGGISILEEDDDQGEDEDTDDDGMPDWWEELYDCVDPSVNDAYIDYDMDWLYNIKEYYNNTDPCDEDSDNGGVIDGSEVSKGTDPNVGSDDFWNDSDKDGLSDGTEDYMCTDPWKADTDGDGYSDLEEINKGTNPCDENDPAEDVDFDSLPETGAYDSDGDGLSDGVEDQIGTDKNNPDTDGDGLSDGEEVEKYGTDPLKADTDSDGVNDYYEVNSSYGEGRKSNPNNADSDGDGYKDGEEDLNGNGKLEDGESDPTDADSIPEAEEGRSLWEQIKSRLYPFRCVFIICGVMCFVLFVLLLIFILLKGKEEEKKKKGEKEKKEKHELPSLPKRRKAKEFTSSTKKGIKRGLPRSPLPDIEKK